MGVQAKYDAAGSGRRMQGWNPPNSGPNTAITGLEKIRTRSRDTSRNSWSGEAAVQRWTTNLIGVGITPLIQGLPNRERKKELNSLWLRWTRYADADGALDFYGMQTLAVRAWLESGEVFMRRRPRRLDGDFEVPVQIQLIESDYVPLLDTDTYPGLIKGNRIRSGIEINQYGRKVAYWVYRDHPGDTSRGVISIDTGKLIRVPAEEMRHIFEPKRPGQLRGVSMLAPMLAALRGVDDYVDAVLERQKLANLFVATIKRSLPENWDGELDEETGLPKFYDSNGTQLVGLEPGIQQTLLPGEEMTFSNPPEAGTTYSDYLRTSHLGTAAGAGMPYELLSGDIKDVSDRTLRVMINEFRRLAEQRQWQLVIPQMCQPAREWFADAAALAGLVGLGELNTVKDVKWSPHGWQHIHPVQDPQGKQMEVEAGFRSRASVIGERGDDPEEVDDERAEDLKREKALDLWVDPNPPAAAPADKKSGDSDGIDNNEYSGPPNARMLIEARAQVLADSIVAAREPVTAQAPVFNITNNVPPAQVHNVVNVEPTPVNVAAPVVNVAAPDVHVAAPVVNMASPDVHVTAPVVNIENNQPPAEVTVNLPARKTESDVRRDKNGNITHVTQTETTVQ